MIIAIDLSGLVVLVGGDRVWELQNLLGPGECLADYIEYSRTGFPEKPGIYRCTIEYYFHQGYLDGYMCDSECDWGVVGRDVEEITIADK